MATLKYLLQSKSDNAPIYLRLSINREKSIKRKTGLQINPSDWSSTTGLPKQNNPQNKNLNSKLRKLEIFIIDSFNEANSEGVEINGDWLNYCIDSHFKRLPTTDLDRLTVFGEDFLKGLLNKTYRKGGKNVKGVSIGTKKKYRTIVNKLIEFEKYRKKPILIKHIDLSFRDELIEYFTEIDNLSENTTGRYLKFVKTICDSAKKRGIETHSELEDFKGYTTNAPKVTLSFNELEEISKTKLLNENHIIARDWLIIGCYIGQRVSDLLTLTKENIRELHGFQFICLEQKKTEKLVQIPVHFEVERILEKRNGNFPPKFSANVESSATLFNRYLKEISKMAGIDSLEEGKVYDKDQEKNIYGKYPKHKLVSSHICRRSFATNFYGDTDYPTPLLINITGHSSEQQFLKYINRKPIDYGLQLAKIWATKALKSKKEPQLSISSKIAN